MNRLGWLAGAFGFAMIFGQAPAVMAQQVATVAGSAKPVAAMAKPVADEEEEAATQKKQGGEGIRVHGHWVLDIKDPDGTLVKHLDFQNSLTTGGGSSPGVAATGDQLLAAILSGTGVISDPGILFVGYNPGAATFPAGGDVTGQCYTDGGAEIGTGKCQMFSTSQSLFAVTGFPFNTDLQTGLSTRVNFSPSVNWVISGNWTVPSSMTSLTAVQTWLPVCIPNGGLLYGTYAFAGSTSDRGASSITMNTCSAGSFAPSSTTYFFTLGPLTSTYVPGAPLTIVPGQIIQVTVTISFS